MLEHVGEVIDRHLEVAVEDPRVEARVLLAVNALRSPPTASNASAMSWALRVVGALEQQVLEEVAMSR